MNISEMVSSGSTLKSEDIKGRGDQTVIIESVSSREFDSDKGKVKKGIITFRGKSKALVCNKVNANLICELYGPETDTWIGKEITLYVARVEFAGKLVDGIRVRLPDRVPDPKHTYTKANTVAAHHDESNPPDYSDVPF
jgi:hypothetical protein